MLLTELSLNIQKRHVGNTMKTHIQVITTARVYVDTVGFRPT